MGNKGKVISIVTIIVFILITGPSFYSLQVLEQINTVKISIKGNEVKHVPRSSLASQRLDGE